MKPAMSETMRAALTTIITAFDEQNAANIARWGAPLQLGISAPGDILGKTLWALADRGLIDVKTTKQISNYLRRGAYGRWIGGSRNVEYTVFTVRPTDAGRAYISTAKAA